MIYSKIEQKIKEKQLKMVSISYISNMIQDYIYLKLFFFNPLPKILHEIAP